MVVLKLLSILSGIIALLYAMILARQVLSQKEGNELMKQLSHSIEKGAMTFLKREYSFLLIFVVIISLLIIWIRGSITGFSFILGAICSALAGFIGMKIATKSNTRTTFAAWESGLSKALKIAFSGGAVMGLSVAGFGLIGLGILYYLFDDPNLINGFALGASSIALFARVGGGIYTKAADVGADLVGKLEAGIPEDDPRNPAVIADNVGDNVGDVAGMGADLFESFVGSIVSCMILGSLLYNSVNYIIYPLILVACGVISVIIATFFVAPKDNENIHKALNMGTYISGILVVISSLLLSFILFGNMSIFFATISGLIAGVAIGFFTQYYTAYDYSPVKKISEASLTGAATTIIEGFALGLKSTALPVIVISIAIYISHYFAGLYGISVAAVGMLSIVGMTVSVDSYGPIADNAGGIAEMAGLNPQVREITDSLDAVGNTTAAIGKGFAIGSAALTAIALFSAYTRSVHINIISITEPMVMIGIFIGGILPFLFGAITIEAVGKTASLMITEVRRQFKEIPGLKEGTAKPEPEKCVDISTKGALKEMIVPGLLAVVVPIIVGISMGPEALGGLLLGAVVIGVFLAIMMANSGGAWDNAKKYIEKGNFGGKNSPAHQAAVIGDTVGDPFKDTAGPSMNILIKVMSIVSLVFIPLFI